MWMSEFFCVAIYIVNVFCNKKMEESRHLDDCLNHYMLLDLCSTSMKKYEILIQCCEKWIYLTQMSSLYFFYGRCKYVNVLFFYSNFPEMWTFIQLKIFKGMLSISAWICHQKKIQKKNSVIFFLSVSSQTNDGWIKMVHTHLKFHFLFGPKRHAAENNSWSITCYVHTHKAWYFLCKIPRRSQCYLDYKKITTVSQSNSIL